MPGDKPDVPAWSLLQTASGTFGAFASLLPMVSFLARKSWNLQFHKIRRAFHAAV